MFLIKERVLNISISGTDPSESRPFDTKTYGRNLSTALFAALEKNNDVEEACSASKIGVANYGVSMTTLEEVFLKLDDSANSDTNKAYEDDESDQNLVIDDGVKEPHLTTQDVRVNMIEFGSDQKLSWNYVLWLQLTALLEVNKIPYFVLFVSRGRGIGEGRGNVKGEGRERERFSLPFGVCSSGVVLKL